MTTKEQRRELAATKTIEELRHMVKVEKSLSMRDFGLIRSIQREKISVKGVSNALSWISVANEISLVEILELLEFQAGMFNELIEALADQDVFLSWSNQPEGVEVWDGSPSFDGKKFLYHGCTQPSGEGVSITVTLPVDAKFERCKPYRRIQAGRLTIEHLAKRLADVERWIERREDYESEQREQQ